MLLSQLFRTRPKAQPSEFKPTCDDCQKYRNLIQQARETGNFAILDTLHVDFCKHVEKEHTHANHS